jgi:TP901 family phage tail tape measure protein
MASEIINILMTFKEQVSAGLAGVDSKLKGFQNNISKIQGALTPLSIASGVAIGGAVKAASEWADASAMAGSVLEISGDKLKDFGNQAEELSKKLNFQKSSTEILNLATAVSKMGVAKNDVIAYSESIVKLATATGQLKDIDNLSTDVAKLGNVFKFTSKDVTEFGAVVNRLDADGATTSSQIINVTQRLSGIGKQSKLSANQIAAWGATLLNASKDASTSATFMNSFLGTLGAGTNLSKDAQAGLKSLGYEAKSLAIAFDKDANGTMLKFLDSVNKLDTVAQREVLGKIFGKEYSDDAALLSGQVDALRKNLVAIGETDKNIGQIADKFKLMSESSLTGQLTSAKNQFNEIAKILGLAILPSVISILKGLTPMLTSFAAFAKTNPHIVSIGVALLGMGAALAPILGIVNAFVTFGAIVPVVYTGVVGLFTSMLALIPGAIVAVTTFGVALWTALAPILPFIAAIAAIAGGAHLIYKNWTPLSNWFNGTFSKWGQGAKLMWNDMATGFNNSMNYMGNGINKFSNDFGNGFNRGMNNAGQSFNNWIQQTGNALNEMTRWLWNGFNNLSRMAWDWGSNFVTNFVNGIKANVQKAADAVGNMTAEMGKFLPHSPSEKGAFRDLDKTGFAFTDTFLSGINKSGLDNFMGGLFQALSLIHI